MQSQGCKKEGGLHRAPPELSVQQRKRLRRGGGPGQYIIYEGLSSDSEGWGGTKHAFQIGAWFRLMVPFVMRGDEQEGADGDMDVFRLRHDALGVLVYADLTCRRLEPRTGIGTAGS